MKNNLKMLLAIGVVALVAVIGLAYAWNAGLLSDKPSSSVDTSNLPVNSSADLNDESSGDTPNLDNDQEPSLDPVEATPEELPSPPAPTISEAIQSCIIEVLGENRGKELLDGSGARPTDSEISRVKACASTK